MREQGSSSSGLSFRGNRIALYGGVAVAVMIVVISALLAATHLRQLAEAQTASATQYLARSMNLSFEGLVDTIDVALQASAHEIGRQISTGSADRASLTRYLERQRERLFNVTSLRATNERGDVLYGSGVPSPPANNADRDYFLSLRDNPKAGLFVVKPLIGRIANKWVWLFVRRISKEDGSFGGVVFASIYIDEIEKMLGKIQMDRGGSIALRDAELGLIARHTFETTNPISEVIPGIHESDPELLERYGRVALSGRPERFETYVASMDMWFSISAYCPQKEHFVAVFDVITERKLAEEKIRVQLDELLRWQELMVGREERMLQLKAEVNALLARQGEPERYPGEADS